MSPITARAYWGRLRRLGLLRGMLLIALPLSATTVGIYVTNYAGDNVSVIDPETNKVVQVIEASKAPTGLTFLRTELESTLAVRVRTCSTLWIERAEPPGSEGTVSGIGRRTHAL